MMDDPILMLCLDDMEFYTAWLQLNDEVTTQGEREFATYDKVIDWPNITAEQDKIVMDRTISHAEKMVKLAIQTVKPKSFKRRVTRASRIHAQGLGIRLD